MPKKKTKDVIEEHTKKDPRKEYAFVHFTGHETVPVTKRSGSRHTTSRTDIIDGLYRKYHKPYTDIHTHPYPYPILPSGRDLWTFLLVPNKEEGRMAIAQVNKKGETVGYLVFGKTKRSPETGLSNFLRAFSYAHQYSKAVKQDMAEQEPCFDRAYEALHNLCKHYHLNTKLVHAKGYTFVRGLGRFVRYRERGKETLEKIKLDRAKRYDRRRESAIGIIAIIFGILLTAPSLTGSVISTTNSVLDISGAIIFLIGLIILLISINKKSIKQIKPTSLLRRFK